MNDYVVCEFPPDEGSINKGYSVEVVYRKGLSSDNKSCRFPPLNRYRTCLKKKLYDECWQTVECKVLSKGFGKFSQFRY